MQASSSIDNQDKINMTLPTKPEYVGVVRIAISAIANRMGFDIEDIDDIKVSVAEACTNAIKHSKSDKFSMDVTLLEKSLEIKIKDTGEGCDKEDYKIPDLSSPNEEGGLGIYIIKALMDSVEINSCKGEGLEIKMVKFLGED